MNKVEQLQLKQITVKDTFVIANLRHSSVVPLYIQVKKALRTEILKGCLRENDPLPAMNVFARSNSISKITVEKAYRELLRDGWVCRVKGSAYFVKEKNNIKSV